MRPLNESAAAVAAIGAAVQLWRVSGVRSTRGKDVLRLCAEEEREEEE